MILFHQTESREISDAYLTICQSLNIEISPLATQIKSIAFNSRLEPGFSITQHELVTQLSLKRSPSLQHDLPVGQAPYILLIEDPGCCVVIDPTFGCAKCYIEKVKLHITTFGVDSSEAPSDIVWQSLPILFYHLHGISVSASKFNPEQNWSLLAPLPLCECCDRSYYGLEWLKRIKLVSKAQKTKHTSSSDADGRRYGPEQFLDLNRFAIGHSSIMGNLGLDQRSEEFPVTYATVPIGPERSITSGGKGPSLHQAVASCLGEGLERYFLTGIGRVQGRSAKYKDLAADERVDLIREFGFPITDNHPSLVEYTENVELEWLPFTHLQTGQTRYLPANFVYCPYMPPEGCQRITSGSTNGAAAGASISDARRQAFLEIVERDAFSFYARTATPCIRVPDIELPSRLRDAMKKLDWAKFHIMIMPTPFFGIHVSQVCMESNLETGSRTSRGTGATFSRISSIERAFSECIQMYSSLSSLKGGPASDPYDMSSLWYDGTAKLAFPGFFSLVEPDHRFARGDIEGSLEMALASASSQGLNVYSYPMVEGAYFSVAKVVVSKFAVTDPYFYVNNDRFQQFARLVGVSNPPVNYTGPLFM